MTKPTNNAVKNGRVPDNTSATQLESKLLSKPVEVTSANDRQEREQIDSKIPKLGNEQEKIETKLNWQIQKDAANKVNSNLSHTSSQPFRDEKLSPQSDNNWSLATYELLDALPQVWTRGLLYFLIVFISIVLPWAMLFKIDETGTARGRLEPEGNTFLLDSPVSGEVTEILVKPGERVRAGQKLVILESSIIRQKLKQQESLLKGQENRLSQLRSQSEQYQLSLEIQQQQNQSQLSEKQARVRDAKQHLESLQQIHYLQNQQQKAQVRQAVIAVNSSQNARDLVSIQLQGAREKLTRYEKAYSQGIISRDRFEEVQQSVKENRGSLLSAESEIALARSRLKESQSSYEKLIQENQSKIERAFLIYSQEKSGYSALVSSAQLALLKTQEQIKNLEKERTTLLAEIEQNKTEIESLLFQLERRTIKAPADGTVFELAMQKAGIVLQPGDKIAEIAPGGSALILKASIATTESGSLEQGMPVKMKFDAYPFQNYGVVEGQLIEISPTSKISETQGSQIATYDLKIELDRSCIPKAMSCIPLRPGDTASAEIIVRQRRIIDLVIDPFKKLSHGGLEL